jgi:hypothetical protein
MFCGYNRTSETGSVIKRRGLCGWEVQDGEPHGAEQERKAELVRLGCDSGKWSDLKQPPFCSPTPLVKKALERPERFQMEYFVESAFLRLDPVSRLGQHFPCLWPASLCPHQRLRILTALRPYRAGFWSDSSEGLQSPGHGRMGVWVPASESLLTGPEAEIASLN